MKLKRIELDGFGKLVKQVYEFGPGLNLIYGRNEAGKSTLQRSILAALYGFFDAGSITVAKKASMMLYEPWDSQASFGLKLTFEVTEGMQYRVERTFAPKTETRLYDLKSGKSINERFTSASQGRLFFAEELLGMPREVFENTSLVRQAELAALEKSASTITDTLLRLSASASQESTTSQAIELLETALKEQVGTQRSRNKPLPEAQRRLENLQSARTLMQNEHHALVNQIAELAQAEESFQKLHVEREKVEYQRLLAQLLIARQQRQIIEQADIEVERHQKTVAQYEAWSLFPISTQTKIQQLTTQFERAQSDTRHAEQMVRDLEQRFSALYIQLDSLRKTLNRPRATQDLPNFELPSAAIFNTTLQNWLDKEFLNLRNIIQEQQIAIAVDTQKLDVLNHIGHQGIAKDRQELGKLETDLAQAALTLQQLQQAIDQAGMPIDQWATILSDSQANVEKWEGWRNYPAQLRDELLQLAAQYTPLYESLTEKSEQISDARNRLAQVQTQLDELQGQISDLKYFRDIPHQEKPRIQEIVFQLETAKQVSREADQQFEEADQVYQVEQKAFDLEKQAIGPLEEVGLAGLTKLQQRWLNATQQLSLAQSRFNQQQATWNKVGMPVDEFQRLENTVKDIQSGNRPTPKPRRGCRTFFMPKLSGTEDQTPTEIAIFSQVQPIYAEFARQQDEVTNNVNSLRLIEVELRQHLGELIPDVIQESTFANLIQALQEYQKKTHLIEQRKGIWDTCGAQQKQAGNRLDQIRTRLEVELKHFDFVDSNVEVAVNLYFKACENKEMLIVAETAFERLQSQGAMIQQQLGQFQIQQQSLADIEEKIIKLLGKANIQVESGALLIGIQRFEEGLESYHHWRVAQSHLEQIQMQIANFEKRLSDARSMEIAKEEKLINFRQQLIKRYSELIPNDFTDQHLAQLDGDLQAYNSAQTGIDKAQGQLEQLLLQAQAIQREINDWAEKENTRQRLESEILNVVHETGIETKQISLVDALSSFENAVQGFANWQQAKRSYDAAVQTQQAVRASLSKLEIEIASLEAKISETTKLHSEWKNLTSSEKSGVYEETSHKINNQILQQRDRLTRLQDAVSRGGKNLRHLAELDEEIELVSAEVQQLSNFSQSLELAISELTISTREFQKVFAPRLESIIETGINQITDGRYQQVKIDPNTLNVQVQAPERNELVETTQLSTGTRDLVYLVLRLGITQLMSNSGEKLPLFLDDPLVEFDTTRQKATLEYLMNLSSQTQILLFSKDDNIKDWLNDAILEKSNCKIIDLA